MTVRHKLVAMLFAGALTINGAALADGPLQKIHFGFATNVISPISIDALIPEYLGYFREEGLTADYVPINSNAAELANFNSRRVDFGEVNVAFVLPIVAKGEFLPSKYFFEVTYPFKYYMAVKKDGPIRSFADLKGKKIGVNELGSGAYPIGKLVAKFGGLDPDKDLSFLAVGEDLTAGRALQRGDVDALFYFDTSLAQIENEGIALTYLPLPAGVPKVGGTFISAHPDILRDHRAWAVGVGRAIAKAHVFIRENLEAAAYVFAQMYPEALPKGRPLEEQVKSVMVPVRKRMELYVSYDKSETKLGHMKDSEFQDEIDAAGLKGKVNDLSGVYTNDLIEDINKFDVEKIKAEARNYKLPYKK